nr:hypothetical protein [Frankia sp. QA3]
MAAEAHRRREGHVAGVVVLDHGHSGAGEQLGEFAGAALGHAHLGRVLRPRLQVQRDRAGGQRLAQRVGAHPVGVRGQRDDLRADQFQQVEQRREAGILHQHPAAVADRRAGDPVEGIHGPVDHRDRLGGERPAGP